MRPGIWQVVIAVAVVCLLFGSKKVVEWARALGQAKGEFDKAMKEGCPLAVGRPQRGGK